MLRWQIVSVCDLEPLGVSTHEKAAELLNCSLPVSQPPFLPLLHKLSLTQYRDAVVST